MERIIVYRNPLEAQVWENIYSSDVMGYMAGILLIIVVGALLWNLLVKHLWQKITGRNSYRW